MPDPNGLPTDEEIVAAMKKVLSIKEPQALKTLVRNVRGELGMPITKASSDFLKDAFDQRRIDEVNFVTTNDGRFERGPRGA
jgi:hypothetical protein